ncbi:hypothetical protein [Shewanella sp. D64]|nr:hypothetical protein [Shewanella sp. D64]
MSKRDASFELDEKIAKEIIKQLHNNQKNWRRKRFREAYYFLTGKNKIPSRKRAEFLVEKWYGHKYCNENSDYVSAVLLLSGKWISKIPRLKNGMSQDVKVKYARGDLSTCSCPVAYRK